MSSFRSIQLYGSFFVHCWRLHFQRMLEYRMNFFFWAFISVMWTAFNFFMLGTIASLNNGIAGWSFAEMMILQAVFSIFDVFIWSWFYPAMSKFTESVFDGSFSGWLLKPLDPFMVMLLKEGNYTNMPRLVVAVAALVWWAPQLPQASSITIVTVLLFVAVLALSLLLLFFFWILISTLSFWFDKFSNINEVIPSMRRLYQIPRQAYEAGGSFLFAFIVPILLVVSVPSEVLVQKMSWSIVLYMVAYTIGLWWLARKFFYFSLTKFTGAGQN